MILTSTPDMLQLALPLVADSLPLQPGRIALAALPDQRIDEQPAPQVVPSMYDRMQRQSEELYSLPYARGEMKEPVRSERAQQNEARLRKASHLKECLVAVTLL